MYDKFYYHVSTKLLAGQCWSSRKIGPIKTTQEHLVTVTWWFICTTLKLSNQKYPPIYKKSSNQKFLSIYKNFAELFRQSFFFVCYQSLNWKVINKNTTTNIFFIHNKFLFFFYFNNGRLYTCSCCQSKTANFFLAKKEKS